jgi:hypothetical protein
LSFSTPKIQKYLNFLIFILFKFFYDNLMLKN